MLGTSGWQPPHCGQAPASRRPSLATHSALLPAPSCPVLSLSPVSLTLCPRLELRDEPCGKQQGREQGQQQLLEGRSIRLARQFPGDSGSPGTHHVTGQGPSPARALCPCLCMRSGVRTPSSLRSLSALTSQELRSFPCSRLQGESESGPAVQWGLGWDRDR